MNSAELSVVLYIAKVTEGDELWFVSTQCEDSAAAALSHISKLQVRHLILLNAGVDVTQPNVF